MQSPGQFDERIGIGGYLRLFAHEVIMPYVTDNSDDIRKAVYMDTDVVVISGLNDLIDAVDRIIEKRNRTGGGTNFPLWTWGTNSGFVSMDTTHFYRFWELLHTLNLTSLLDNRPQSDQALMARVADHYQLEVETMPTQWSVHIGHGYRRAPQSLYDHKLNAGMVSDLFHHQTSLNDCFHFTVVAKQYLAFYLLVQLHFTGINTGASYFSDEGIVKFCRRGNGCNETDINDVNKMESSWGIAEHYVKLPWHWVKYQGGM